MNTDKCIQKLDKICSPFLQAHVQIPLKQVDAKDDFILHPVFLSTFLLVQNILVQNRKSLVMKLSHIDLNGAVINQLDLGICRYIRLYMVNDRVVLIENYNSLTQWNLQNNQIIKTAYKSKESCQLYVFSGSGILVIEDRFNYFKQGDQKNYIYTQISSNMYCIKTTMTVYKLPFLKPEEKPINKLTKDRKNNHLTNYDSSMKLNNCSKIAWLKQIDCVKELNYMSLGIYDPLQKYQEIWQYKLSDSFLQEKRTLFSAGIQQVWEYNPGLLYVKCRVWLSYKKYRKLNKFLCLQQIQRLLRQQKYIQLIWQYKQNVVYPFDGIPNNFQRNIQFSNGLRPIINMKVFYKRTANNFLKNQYGQRRQRLLPVYHINPENMTIIGYEKPNMALEQYPKICFPEFDNTLYLQYNVRKTSKKIDAIFRKTSYLTQPIALYLAFILQSAIKMCDGDLIQYVCQLIGDMDEKLSYFELLKWKRIQN